MNRLFRNISISGLMLVLVSVVSLGLVGCGRNDDGNDNPLGLINRGVLTIATDADFAPFENIDAQGNPYGISIAIIREVATMLGLTLDIRLMDWNATLMSTQVGQADMAVAGITIREDRRAVMDFTIPWFQAGQVVVTHAGNTALDNMSAEQIRAHLNGQTVGGVVGQSGALSAESWGANVQGFEMNAPMLLAVANQTGGLRYAVMDNVAAKAAARDNPNLRVVNTVLTSEQYGFAVRQGNAELLYQVNNAMATMLLSGRIDAIFAHYAPWL